MVSLIGTWMQTAALHWLAFDLTGLSRWPALVTTAQALPTLLFGAWSGTVADRYPKRAVLLGTQGSFFLVSLTLTTLVLTGAVTPVLLVGLMAAHGLVQALDLPTRLAFLKDLVGRADLMNAVALNSLMFNIARLAGPALAASVVLTYGIGVCFVANTLSYLAVLAALFAMTARGTPTPAQPGDRRHDLLGGFRYLAGQPRLALLLGLVTIMTLCGWPFLTLLPALTRKALGLSADGYSLMLSSTGLGALVGALTLAAVGSPARRFALIGSGVGVVGSGLLGLSLARQPVLAAACCAAVGGGLILVFATSQSLVQLGADDRHRGRVMGIWAMCLNGAMPLGCLLVGLAADRWGEPAILRWQSAVCGLALLTFLGLARRGRATTVPPG
jgi:predicted MFS family arabinose efflux permease